jgi:DNA-binding MarR family transcriptional regulator
MDRVNLASDASAASRGSTAGSPSEITSRAIGSLAGSTPPGVPQLHGADLVEVADQRRKPCRGVAAPLGDRPARGLLGTAFLVGEELVEKLESVNDGAAPTSRPTRCLKFGNAVDISKSECALTKSLTGRASNLEKGFDILLHCRYNLDMEHRPSKYEAADRMARECIAVRVRLINRVLTALYDEALRPFSLRISQANILSAIGLLGESRPSEVSRVLRIEKSTLSRDVELMKQKRWLESDPPAGGRNQTIRLTPQGAKLLAKIEPSWEKAQAQAKLLIGEEGEAALQQMASRLGFGKTAS